MWDKTPMSMVKEKKLDDWKDRYKKLANAHNKIVTQIEDSLFNLQAFCKNNKVKF